MDKLIYSEARLLGLRSRIDVPIKSSWRIRNIMREKCMVKGSLTEVCCVEGSLAKVNANGNASLLDGEQECQLELNDERILSIAELNGQLLTVSSSSQSLQLKVRVCESIMDLLEAARGRPTIDLGKMLHPVLESMNILTNEVICIDRKRGWLVVRQGNCVKVIDAILGSSVIAVVTPINCNINYSNGFLAIWWNGPDSTITISHIKVALAEVKALCIHSDQDLDICIPIVSGFLIKKPASPLLSLDLGGQVSRLGSIVHIYISEPDGESFLVHADGRLTSPDHPSLEAKLKSPLSRLIAGGQYLFAISSSRLLVIERSTFKVLDSLTSQRFSSNCYLSFNEEEQRLWIGDSQGRVCIVD